MTGTGAREGGVAGAREGGVVRPREVLVLGSAELRGLLTLDVVVPAIEAAYVANARGEATIFPVVREALPEGMGVFGIKSGHWPARDALGLKAAGYWPGNRGIGLDNHQATVLLIDPATGTARALMDGNWITYIRTAAAGAIGAIHLARPDSRRAVIVGTGVQGDAQARALAWWRPDLDLTVFEPLDEPDGRRASAFCERLARDGIACRPVAALEYAVAAADIVVTATPSNEPLVRRAWLRPGTHVNAMGADTRGKQEHEVETLRDARVVVDDWRQARQLGECQHAVAAGLFADVEPASIGAIIAGEIVGRETDAQITLFDATGIALQDLAAADLAYRLAHERGLGTIISLD
jgi:ornithine cyclodeaminase